MAERMGCCGTVTGTPPWPWFRRSTPPSVIVPPEKPRSATCYVHETNMS